MENGKCSNLKLKNAVVIFWNKGKDGFKPSLVVDADDPNDRAKISKWVKENRIGKGEQAGKPYFSTHTSDDGVKHFRYLFRITKKTVFRGLNGLGEADLGYGARVSLIAGTYKYSQFGGGIGQSLLAVKVLEPARNGNDEYADELMNEHDDEDDIELEDFDEVEDESSEIREEDIPSFD
ncbi:hypothetical protein IKE80_00970 [Candidatus Saccharibacteria bacterium]|nr:hypothetical protein [Candidatus Saccharibacteria bacterium]